MLLVRLITDSIHKSVIANLFFYYAFTFGAVLLFVSRDKHAVMVHRYAMDKAIVIGTLIGVLIFAWAIAYDQNACREMFMAVNYYYACAFPILITIMLMTPMWIGMLANGLIMVGMHATLDHVDAEHPLEMHLVYRLTFLTVITTTSILISVHYIFRKNLLLTLSIIQLKTKLIDAQKAESEAVEVAHRQREKDVGDTYTKVVGAAAHDMRTPLSAMISGCRYAVFNVWHLTT